jgi:hypothetical protein
LHRALSTPGNAPPRVINVDKNPAYPAAIEALKTVNMIRKGRVRWGRKGMRSA